MRCDSDQPWFTQKQLVEMFGVTIPTVINHIKGFTDGGELDGSTIRDFEVVRREGDRQVTRSVQHYGLDVAFYVGYRVNVRAWMAGERPIPPGIWPEIAAELRRRGDRSIRLADRICELPGNSR